MNIKQETIKGILLLKPDVKVLDFASGPLLKTALEPLVVDCKGKIILDLSDVTSIDSRALSALVAVALSIVKKKPNSLALIATSEKILEVLRLTHMDSLLFIASSQEEAISLLFSEKMVEVMMGYVGSDSSTFLILKESAPFPLSVVQFTDKSSFKTVHVLFIEELVLDSIPPQANIGEKEAVLLVDRLPIPEKTVSWMKERGVSHFLLKPLSLPKMQEFLQQMMDAISSKEKQSPKEQIATKLYQQYRQTVIGKLELLQKGVEACRKSPSKEHFLDLRGHLHKIAGSAGSYGFSEAGKTAKEGELLIDKHLENGIFDESLINKTEKVIEKLTIEFGSFYFKKAEDKQLSLLPLKSKSLLLISDDPTTCAEVKLVTETGGLVCEILEDPENAIDAITKKKERPSIILVEEHFLTYKLKGLTVVEMLQKAFADARVHFILIVDDEAVSHYIEADRLGIQTILKKPIHQDRLKQLLAQEVEKDNVHDFRVMVLDDDPDVGLFIKEALEGIDIKVEILIDETKVLEELSRVRPDLLFLDINMPKYDGWSLLKALRKDVRYKSLLIAIITSADSTIFEKALALGANEVFLKPLAREKIQREVLKIAQESGPSLKGTLRSSSFLNKGDFIARVLRLQQGDPQNRGILLTFSSTDFSEVKKMGDSATEEFIIASENALLIDFFDATLKGHFGEDHFLLFFREGPLELLQQKLHQFLKKWEFNITIPTKKDFFGSLEGTALPCPPASTLEQQEISFPTNADVVLI